jgi:Adenylate cyclase, family 3 (some proteins contain HAMP domain)
MTLGDELRDSVKATFSKQWAKRKSGAVPDTDDVALGNDAVTLEAGTVLYADLSDSTGLVLGHTDSFAAEIYKTYLYCAARIARSLGGEITAYDGDRVMAVFVGDAKNSNAAQAALKINYATREIVAPAMLKQYPQTTYRPTQTVGIDTSPLFVARTGIRGSNDLVWVGQAANYAAKMAALPPKYATYISEAVYDKLNEGSKLSGKDGRDMWTSLGSADVGIKIYGSGFLWNIP